MRHERIAQENRIENNICAHLAAHDLAIQVTLFEAAMPPMITAAIIASEHDLDPELATLMVAVGLLVSFVTLGGWWWVLQGV